MAENRNNSLLNKIDIYNNKLDDIMLEAWDTRQKKFGSQIEFYRPSRTLSVSATGRRCELNCSHCGRQYLKSMVPIQNVQNELTKKKCTSCLISGGCNLDGKVDFLAHSNLIKDLKKEHKINMHVGFLEDKEIEHVTELADVISLDIPASDRVISEVYGLKLTRQDYLDEYNQLRNKIKTVPHICIGLGEGIESELSTLNIMAENKPDVLSLIIFTPTPNTKMESRNPPEINDVLKVIAFARLKLPDTNLILGCMRPRGAYREMLDPMAVEAGLNGLVMPSKTALQMVQEKGLNVIWKEECCSL